MNKMTRFDIALLLLLGVFVLSCCFPWFHYIQDGEGSWPENVERIILFFVSIPVFCFFLYSLMHDGSVFKAIVMRLALLLVGGIPLIMILDFLIGEEPVSLMITYLSPAAWIGFMGSLILTIMLECKLFCITKKAV